MRRPIIIIVVVVVHNSMLIVDQTSSFLGSLGKLNYIKYYSLSISKVYSMWTLLTMSLLTLWKLMIHHYIQLLNDMLQNCWLSDDKITVILWSQNSSENNLFLLNRLPVPPNEEEKAPLCSFQTCCKNLHVRTFTLRISSVTLQKYQLSLFLNQVNAK